MSLAPNNLTEIDPNLVAQMTAELTTQIQAYNPSIDLSGGLFQTLLLNVCGVILASNQENINLYTQSNSLEAVNTNPSLADQIVLANLLSNYNIVASPGVQATGNITIVLTSLTATVITAGSLFTVNGLTFSPLLTYTGRTSSGAVVSPTDVLITSFPGSLYAFTIPVTSTLVGAAGNVTINSAVTPTTTIPNYSKAFVQQTFIGGQDADTNTTLLAKLANGMAVKAWASRPTILGLIQAQSSPSGPSGTLSSFAGIVTDSIIGFLDPEMIRDEHSIWPGHLGGRSDLYLQSQPLYVSNTFQVTATLISKVSSVGTWQFPISVSESPGFYKVTNILLTSQDPSTTGFTPLTDTRGFDLTDPPNPPAPDIITPIEGVYSRYQTAVITFVDTITNATSLTINVSTQLYNVTTILMPLVDSVQDWLNDRSRRPPNGDCLVKAPIPCFTTISFTVNYNSVTVAPVIATIQNAVSSAVNSLNFVGTLSTSLISSTLHNLLPNLVSVTAYSLVGNIRNVDGSITNLSSSVSISIPNNFALQLSSRTCCFYLQPTDVSVTLNPVVVPNV